MGVTVTTIYPNLQYDLTITGTSGSVELIRWTFAGNVLSSAYLPAGAVAILQARLNVLVADVPGIGTASANEPFLLPALLNVRELSGNLQLVTGGDGSTYQALSLSGALSGGTYNALIGVPQSANAPATGDAAVVAGGSSGAGTTAGPATYYVNPSTGSDANPGTQALPFATIDAAVGKVRGLTIVDPIRIIPQPGTYSAGAYLIGLRFGPARDPSIGRYLLICPNMTLASPATGTASGTSTAGSNGSNATRATLTDGGQTWTVNDLQNKLLETAPASTTSGVNRPWYVIESNTATQLNLADGPADAVGRSGLASGLGASVAYNVYDWDVVINGALAQTFVPKSANLVSAPFPSTLTNFAAFVVGSNHTEGNADIVIRGLKFTNTTGRAIAFLDRASATVEGCRFETSANCVLVSGSTNVNLFHNSVKLGAGALFVGGTSDFREPAALWTVGNVVDGNAVGAGGIQMGNPISRLTCVYDTFKNGRNTANDHAMRFGPVQDGEIKFVTIDTWGGYGIRWAFTTAANNGEGALGVDACTISNTGTSGSSGVLASASLPGILTLDNLGVGGTTGTGNHSGITISGSTCYVANAWAPGLVGGGIEIILDGINHSFAELNPTTPGVYSISETRYGGIIRRP